MSLFCLYQVDSTQANALVGLLHDVLQKLNVSITKIRGLCYDGVASMSGVWEELQHNTKQRKTRSHPRMMESYKPQLYSYFCFCTGFIRFTVLQTSFRVLHSD